MDNAQKKNLWLKCAKRIEYTSQIMSGAAKDAMAVNRFDDVLNSSGIFIFKTQTFSKADIKTIESNLNIRFGNKYKGWVLEDLA